MTGQYAHTVDAKGRLFIPARLRQELGDTLHVIAGQDGCLSIFSDESWDAMMERLHTMDYKQVKRLRAAFAYATECEPDGQGRILLPAALRKYANLTKDVVIIGSFDRAEIWDADTWNQLEAEAFDSGELARAMEEMGL